MAHAQANYGFTVKEEKGKHVFIYQQERYREKHLLPLLVGLPLFWLLILLMFQPGSFIAGLILWIGLTLGCFYLAKYILNLTRKEKHFTIDNQFFEVDGHSYARKDVTALYFQAGRMSPVASITFNHGTAMAFPASAGGFMAAGAYQATHALGNTLESAGRTLHQNMAKVNCKILLRYGNKNITLADGLTADTADVMLRRITELCEGV